MSNATINKALLDSTTSNKFILEHIAMHYDATVEEAYEHMIDPETENLLDYMVGEERATTSLLMQQWAISIFLNHCN